MKNSIQKMVEKAALTGECFVIDLPAWQDTELAEAFASVRYAYSHLRFFFADADTLIVRWK